MLNIASGRRARTELASSARAPGAEKIEDRSRRLVIPGTVGGKRLTGESQFGTRSVVRFAESGACTRFDARGDRTRDQVRDRGTGVATWPSCGSLTTRAWLRKLAGGVDAGIVVGRAAHRRAAATRSSGASRRRAACDVDIHGRRVRAPC